MAARGSTSGCARAPPAAAASVPIGVDDAVRHFAGARRDLVARHLETLSILGEVQPVGDGRFGVPVGAY